MNNKEINEKLRLLGKIKSTEIFLQEGDLFIAQDVLSNKKRIIEKDEIILKIFSLNENTNRRILKG